jgi:hypothetical protein
VGTNGLNCVDPVLSQEIQSFPEFVDNEYILVQGDLGLAGDGQMKFIVL